MVKTAVAAEEPKNIQKRQIIPRPHANDTRMSKYWKGKKNMKKRRIRKRRERREGKRDHGQRREKETSSMCRVVYCEISMLLDFARFQLRIHWTFHRSAGIDFFKLQDGYPIQMCVKCIYRISRLTGFFAGGLQN